MDGSRPTARRSARWGLLIVLAIAASLLVPAAPSEARSKTKVRFELEARSWFDRWITDSSHKQRKWMRNHYWRVRGFAPFYDQALGWSSPAHFYQNAYSIYTDASSRERAFALKDRYGNRLYIPFDCGGGCPQYAADFGNREWQRQWIELARKRLNRGYRGIFIDDVNLEWRVSDRWGNHVLPIDPRTNRHMTLADWRRYQAEFMERIRRELPNAELVHNNIWWVPHSDPYLKRQVRAADFIQLERGYNDRGLVGGNSKWGFVRFIRHIDWIHRQGASVIFQPEDLNRWRAEFELAGYHLTKARRDTIDSDWRATKSDWWRGWGTDLGEPKRRWYRWHGLFRRDFKKGMVLVNQPYAPTRRVTLPRSKRFYGLEGRRIKGLSVKGGTGRVLTR